MWRNIDFNTFFLIRKQILCRTGQWFFSGCDIGAFSEFLQTIDQNLNHEKW